jgi:hypothetical protein
MPRQLKKKADASVLQASVSLSLTVGKQRPKQARKGTRSGRLESLVVEVDKMVSDGHWPEDKKKPETLVALFCWAHEAVYGVSCVADTAKLFNGAVSAAKKLIADEFGGSFDDTLEYVRWVWKREQSREKWRRENGGGRVLTWFQVFKYRNLVMEMRVDSVRTKGVP